MVVSVVVPVYNVAPYLKRCIDSILNQTEQDLELILVDDGSTDGSGEICDEYADDPKVTVIHKKNGGLSDARNTGIREARGEYILFVDSDDYVDADILEKLLAGTKDGVDVVIGGYRKIYDDYMILFQCDGIIPDRVYSPEEYFKYARIDVVVCGNLFRRKYLIDNGIFFRVGFRHEDNEIFVRLYLQAAGIVGVKGTFYNYVVRENSLNTGKMSEDRERCLMIIFKDWLNQFSAVKDPDTRKNLLNYLITTYLNICHDYRLKGWRVDGLDLRFVLKHTERLIIKIKAVWFTVSPETYFRVRVTRKPKKEPLCGV